MAVPVNTSYLFTIIQIYFYTLYQCVRNHRQFLINNNTFLKYQTQTTLNKRQFKILRQERIEPSTNPVTNEHSSNSAILGYRILYNIYDNIFSKEHSKYKNNKTNTILKQKESVIYIYPIWSGKIISVVQIRFWSGKGRFKFWSGVVQKQCENLVEWKYP
ncbi:Hypothetical_protein [Hexamita inflata]|uniref:Hypothetical_protein n=1 Tax=Hexamita inflata TaxID=28002 RepID=A0AA86PFI3_9EUKA|nr:Hypothetical protein HINF_LOCUS22447 [Hexamita inflata]